MALQMIDDDASTTRPVRWLVVTSVLEGLGDSLSRSLLPIVAVSVLGAGTAVVGVVNSVGLAAFLLLGLPVGVLADRWSAPTAMMTLSTIARAGVALAAVVCWLGGWLAGGVGTAVVLGLALAIGVADVGYTTAQGMLVPRLVAADEIRAVYGRVQASAQIGGTAGPALLSAALVAVAAPVAWLVPAAAYAGSAVAQRRITPVAPAPARPVVRESAWASARAGAGVLLRSRVLRRVTLATTLSNAAVMAANTLLPVIVLTRLGVPPAVYAALGLVGAVAGVAGAAAAARVTARLGLVAARVACAAAMTAGVLVVMAAGATAPLLPGPVELWLGLQSALTGGAASIALVAGADLVPRIAPASSLGTVLAAQRVATLGVMPVTAVVVGAGGALLGAGAMTLAWLLLAAASALPLAGLRRSELP